MTIAAILQDKGGEVVSVPGEMPIAEVVALLAERRIGAVPVIEDGAVRGILAERDILCALASAGADMLGWPAERLMTSPAPTTRPDTPILAALALMTRQRIRHLPVIDGGRLVGIVSIGDLVKARIDRIESEAAAMRDYIQGA